MSNIVTIPSRGALKNRGQPVTSSSTMTAAPKNGANPRKVPTFLTNAFNMITECTKNNPSVARWDPNGTSFTIYDKDRLGKEEIPKYFKHNQYSSFMRSLNSYRFKKVGVEGTLSGVPSSICHRYSHPGFIQGHIERLSTIHTPLPKAAKGMYPIQAKNEVHTKDLCSLEKENEILKLANANLQSEIARLQAELAQLKAHRDVESTSFAGMKRRYNGDKNMSMIQHLENCWIEKSKKPATIRIRSGQGFFEDVPNSEEPLPSNHYDLNTNNIVKNENNLPKKIRKPVHLKRRQSSRLVFTSPTVHHFVQENKEGLLQDKPETILFRSNCEENQFLELMFCTGDDELDKTG